MTYTPSIGYDAMQNSTDLNIATLANDPAFMYLLFVLIICAAIAVIVSRL